MVPLKSYLHTETNLKNYGLLSSVFQVEKYSPFVLSSDSLIFLMFLCRSECYFSQFCHSRGDWLGKPANIKVENNGAVGYVKSSLTVYNPSVCVHKTE